MSFISGKLQFSMTYLYNINQQEPAFTPLHSSPLFFSAQISSQAKFDGASLIVTSQKVTRKKNCKKGNAWLFFKDFSMYCICGFSLITQKISISSPLKKLLWWKHRRGIAFYPLGVFQLTRESPFLQINQNTKFWLASCSQ